MDKSIYVDNRIGSKEVAPLLDELLPAQTPTKLRRLEYGDFFFTTETGGPGDQLATIGIERKRLRDMVQSVMSGRLSGSQLPGMAEHYDFIVLIVEGVYRCNPDNKCLEIRLPNGHYTNRLWNNRTLDYRSLDASINTLRLKTPVHIIKTWGPNNTAMEIFHLWHWFQSKKWSAHSSHIQFPHLQNDAPIVTPGKASWFRRFVKELPNIGWKRSQAVEDLFDGDFRRAVNADVETWTLIDGITEKRAIEIVRALRGGREE